MRYLVETIVGYGGALCLAAGFVLMIPAAITSLIKIDEADRYFGVGRYSGEYLTFKGLPFSLGRMTGYGLLMLFSRTSYVKSHYALELAQIAANAPPQRLVRLLAWLYSSWFLLVVVGLILGGIPMLIG